MARDVKEAKGDTLVINKRNYVLGLSWHEVYKVGDIKKVLSATKQSVGVYLKGQQLLGLCDKSRQGKTALAPIISAKLKNGVFVTNCIPQKLEEEVKYYLVFFENKRLLSRVTLGEALSFPNDGIFTASQAKQILSAFNAQEVGDSKKAQKGKKAQKIFADMTEDDAKSLGVEGFKSVTLEKLAKASPRRYRIKDQRRHLDSLAMGALIFGVIGVAGYFGYQYLTRPQPKPTHFHMHSDPFAKLVNKINADNGYRVLSAINTFNHKLPVASDGWQLAQLNYSAYQPNTVELTFLRKGGDALSAKSLLSELPINSKGTFGGVAFLNNANRLRVSSVLNEIDTKALSKVDVKRYCTTASKMAFIAGLQRANIHVQMPKRRGAFTDFSFGGLVPISFKNLLVIAQKNPCFSITSLSMRLNQALIPQYLIKGAYYAR